MTPGSTLSGIRRRAVGLYREYRAILILTNRCNRKERVAVDNTLRVLPHEPAKRLQSQLPALKSEIAKLRKLYGAKASAKELIALAESRPRTGPDEFLYLPKSFIGKIFSNYENAIPRFEKFPPGARVQIDMKGSREDRSRIEIFILEAFLFEDMALLWNDLWELNRQKPPKTRGEQRLLSKRKDALTRAVGRSAFALLEGYLNSLAGGILELQSVTEDERSKLTDWDEARQRPRFLRLADKIQQYPRIAIRASHPPLHKHSCPEMEMILNYEETIRNSLMHPTPFDDVSSDRNREMTFIFLSVDDVQRLCDAVVGLIRRIAQIVGPRFGDVAIWLHDRESEGRFPDAAYE